ncbi:MAG: extracellular solute-binding protein, partial [Clostridiales bacterium]|nr:extracellular solute-binding protein [Clostridiales bacterium]
MRKQTVKWLGIFLVLVLVLGLVACNGTDTKDEQSTKVEETKKDEVVKEEATEKPQEPITLTMWDDAASEENARVIAPIIEKWNAENPNTQIVRDAVDVESYKMKLKTAVAAGEAPDIFFSWGAGFSQPFVEAGKVLALDDYLSDEIRANLKGGVLANTIYDGKIYALPYNAWYGVLYCNTELFEANNLELPTTYDELLAVSKAFRAAGIGPIGVGVSEGWTAMFYQNILAVGAVGADETNAILAGNGRYDTDEMLLAATRLKELVDAEAFIDGYMGLNYDEFMASFKQGEIPMVYQGSWEAGEMVMEEYPVNGKVVPIKFPSENNAYLGGCIDIYMVSADTEYKEEAVRAVEYIAQNMSSGSLAAGIGLPVYKGELDESSIDAVTKEILNLTSDADGLVLAWDTFLTPDDAQLHLDLCQELFAGVKTPAEFVAGM